MTAQLTAHLMDPLAAVGTASLCPGCGSGHTAWVRAGAADNLLCKTCGTCWHAAARHAEPVDVLFCPGCGSRAVCLAARG